MAITGNIEDEDSPKAIQEFVRQSPDFIFSECVRRGNNGEVYFGTRVKLNDDVALKFYWAQQSFDSSEEAVILRKLDHDHILKVWDLKFLAPNWAYFVTPRVSGGDLQQNIDLNSISSGDALQIVSQILIGLTELHSQHELVHRDLKPGNILLDSEGRAIIADLGAVKKIDKATGHASDSKATLYYLPPESIKEKKYYYQSDIYQVGLILFQLLGGFFPLGEPMRWLSAKEVKKIEAIRNTTERYAEFEIIIGRKITKGTLANLDTLPMYLDRSFHRVLQKALNSDYKKRYESAAKFLQDVHNLMRTTPSYMKVDEGWLIEHESGDAYKISQTKRGKIVLEKSTKGKAWRKINTHKNTFESALSIARN